MAPVQGVSRQDCPEEYDKQGHWCVRPVCPKCRLGRGMAMLTASSEHWLMCLSCRHKWAP